MSAQPIYRENRSQESEVRSQESEVRSQESGEKRLTSVFMDGGGDHRHGHLSWKCGRSSHRIV